MDKSKVIFGNEIAEKDYRKSCKKKKKYLKKFGDDSSAVYRFAATENPVLAGIGVKDLVLSEEGGFEPDDKALIVGNIRMGYGHYRISMAIASAAHALGYKPYWLDLNSYSASTATKIISYQNDLYSTGSRLSQKFSLFNKLVWEPMNYEGFRKLTYNSADQKVSELMVPLINGLPKDVPYIATHAWPAQAAVHAGFKRVINCIPDNWPMALHLSEGSIHTVQTPNAFIGYKSLRGMDKKRELKPMPEGTLYNVGHYVDHELAVNIKDDCAKRIERLKNGAPRRFLLSLGGAGAQQKLFESIIRHLVPQVREGRAALYINAGDHKNVLESIIAHVPELADNFVPHYGDFENVKAFVTSGDEDMNGIHIFLDSDIFAAVYTTNLLMRIS
ncbi:MAG: hypothetical protein IK047_00455, partial [Clostridia bacterium]|nr:hypothetical protein [Clostridia bacterium]